MDYISVYMHSRKVWKLPSLVTLEVSGVRARDEEVDERRREAQMSRLTTWGEEWKKAPGVNGQKGQLLSICEDLMGQKPNWIVVEQVGRERMELISNNTALSTGLAVSKGEESWMVVEQGILLCFHLGDNQAC